MASSPSRDLDLILNLIEERSKPTRAQIGRFKVAVLSLIEPKLPSIGLECLTLGKHFAVGLDPEQPIREALVRCWEYSDQRSPGGGLETSEANAVRSVISLLHGLISDEEDFVDSLSFFLTLVNNVEPHHSQQAELLNQHFGVG